MNQSLLPGTTSITGLWPEGKEALAGWMVKMVKQGEDPKLITRKAAEEGTCTHYLAQCEILGLKPDLDSYPKEVAKAGKASFRQFKKWLKTSGVAVLGTELQMVSETYRYGGTIDILAYIDGVLSVADIKRTPSIYSSHRLQLAAYVQLVKENLKIDDVSACIIRLNKTGTGYEARHYGDLSLEWKCFLLCREIYDLIPQLRARE